MATRSPLLKADKQQIISCMLKNIEAEMEDAKGGVQLGQQVRKLIIEPALEWLKKRPTGMMSEIKVYSIEDRAKHDDRFMTGEISFTNDKNRGGEAFYYNIDLADGPVITLYGDIVEASLPKAGNEKLYKLAKDERERSKKLEERKKKVEREMTQLLARYNSYETLLNDFPDLVVYCGDVKKNSMTSADRIKSIKKLIDGK